MVSALRDLGFVVHADREMETIRIQGRGGQIPNRQANLFVGNAGTAARFLTALCCLAPEGVYEIDGVAEMRKRPMKGLLDALIQLGAAIESKDGHFPIRIQARGLSGGSVRVDAKASSQMLSALLMVAPLAREDCSFSFENIRLPFVRMTLRMMEEFGQNLAAPDLSGGELKIFSGKQYQRPNDGTYRVEADVTAASYFATLPLVTGGSITIDNLRQTTNGLQGDAAYFGVLEKLGCRIVATDGGGSRFESPDPRPAVAIDADFSGFSDTFLTLAAVAPLLKFPTRIRGIAHTRKQETDRVAGMAKELLKLGQHITEKEDALEIEPYLDALKQPDLHLVDTYRDHRFAMSFSLLGLLDLHGDGRPWLAIRDPGCCAKTFPHFFDVLENVRKRSHQATTA